MLCLPRWYRFIARRETSVKFRELWLFPPMLMLKTRLLSWNLVFSPLASQNWRELRDQESYSSTNSLSGFISAEKMSDVAELIHIYGYNGEFNN